MLTNEILSSIDNIDDCVMEAEMNVLNALCNEYDKAIMIMENYSGNDYSSFDIFQEGFKDEVNKPVFGVKGENWFKRIGMIIPRLIAMIVNAMKKLVNKILSRPIKKQNKGSKQKNDNKNLDNIDFKTVDENGKTVESRPFGVVVVGDTVYDSCDFDALTKFLTDIKDNIHAISTWDIINDPKADKNPNVNKILTRMIAGEDPSPETSAGSIVDIMFGKGNATQKTYTIDEYNKKRNDLKNLMSSIESDCKDASARLGDVINKDPDKFAKTTHTSVNLICTYLRQTLLSDIVEMSKGLSKRYSDENNK